jgi:hypothetical protein
MGKKAQKPAAASIVKKLSVKKINGNNNTAQQKTGHFLSAS